MRTPDHKDLYFVDKDSMSLQYLQYEDKEVMIDNVTYIKKIDKSTGILHAYTQDCPRIQRKIDHIGRPQHQNLIDLAVAYNNLTCSDQSCEIYTKEMRSKIKLMVSGGIGLFNPSMDGRDRIIVSGMPGKSHYYPAYDVKLLFNQPKSMNPSTSV